MIEDIQPLVVKICGQDITLADRFTIDVTAISPQSDAAQIHQFTKARLTKTDEDSCIRGTCSVHEACKSRFRLRGSPNAQSDMCRYENRAQYDYLSSQAKSTDSRLDDLALEEPREKKTRPPQPANEELDERFHRMMRRLNTSGASCQESYPEPNNTPFAGRFQQKSSESSWQAVQRVIKGQGQGQGHEKGPDVRLGLLPHEGSEKSTDHTIAMSTGPVQDGGHSCRGDGEHVAPSTRSKRATTLNPAAPEFGSQSIVQGRGECAVMSPRKMQRRPVADIFPVPEELGTRAGHGIFNKVGQRPLGPEPNMLPGQMPWQMPPPATGPVVDNFRRGVMPPNTRGRPLHDPLVLPGNYPGTFPLGYSTPWEGPSYPPPGLNPLDGAVSNGPVNQPFDFLPYPAHRDAVFPPNGLPPFGLPPAPFPATVRGAPTFPSGPINLPQPFLQPSHYNTFPGANMHPEGMLSKSHASGPPAVPDFNPLSGAPARHVNGADEHPSFPVTRKPRDHDPIKQQQYESYLEWRKAHEPGYHQGCKWRQANRILRQYNNQTADAA